MDISSGLKQATALAKEKKFDLAIELLMKLLPEKEFCASAHWDRLNGRTTNC